MVSLRDTFLSATQSLVAHPLRSGLTMLGVIIGNAAFVTMASLGEAAKQYTVQRLEAFHGPNRLLAYASPSAGERVLASEPKLLSERCPGPGEGGSGHQGGCAGGWGNLPRPLSREEPFRVGHGHYVCLHHGEE